MIFSFMYWLSLCRSTLHISWNQSLHSWKPKFLIIFQENIWHVDGKNPTLRGFIHRNSMATAGWWIFLEINASWEKRSTCYKQGSWNCRMLELLLKQRLEYSLLPRNGSHPVIISLLHPPLLEAITQLPSVRRIVLKRRAEKWAAPSASSYIGG